MEDDVKFNCGPTWDEKIAAKEQWHEWFAWYPVTIAPHDCRWLETIERKGKWVSNYGGDWWEWEYRTRLAARQENQDG